jgi:uncharacterized membrane protein required for colicin V production
MDQTSITPEDVIYDSIIGLIASAIVAFFGSRYVAPQWKQVTAIFVSVLCGFLRCLATGKFAGVNLSTAIVTVLFAAYIANKTVMKYLNDWLEDKGPQVGKPNGSD